MNRNSSYKMNRITLTKGQDKPKLELKEKNAEVEIQNVLSNPKQYESIKFLSIKNDDAKAILKVCGSETKKFIWYPNDEEVPIKASDLIEILNLMPKLESFTPLLTTPNSPNLTFKTDKAKVKLNLPNLKSLHTPGFNANHKLLSKILPKNSITEFSTSSIGIQYLRNLTGHQDEKLLVKFLSKQKSIKKFTTDNKIPLNSVKMFELEGIEFLRPSKTKDIVEALSSQPKLKTLKLISRNMKEIIAICKLPQLETLQIGNCNADAVKKLKSIKTLKVLEIRVQYESFFQNFLDEKHLTLQKLTIFTDRIDPNFDAKMLENLPNLTYLKIPHTIQKFNTFAKFLPKLEELHLILPGDCYSFCELDTGIVNKNLKKVHIGMLWCKRIEEVFEIIEICPNLEELKLDNSLESRRDDAVDSFIKSFLERLSKVKSLITLSLSQIWLEDFPNFYPQLADDLKKISTKLKFVEIKFHFKNNLSYAPLFEMLKDEFEVYKVYDSYSSRRPICGPAAKKARKFL